MVAAGAAELKAGGEPLARARRPGGGRKKLADTDPGLRPALLALVEPGTRGDPMSPLRWTTLSTRNLAAELTRQGHRAGPDTVAKLLQEEGFSLQGNAKTAEGAGTGPGRPVPADQRAGPGPPGCRAAGDQRERKEETERRQLQERRPGMAPGGRPGAGQRLRLHRQGQGQGHPLRGVRRRHELRVGSAGTDHETAAFAVQTIRTWWQKAGEVAYPDAARLLICADGGGSNGYRTRLWKTELAALAAGTGCRSPSAISRRAPPSGTKSSTGCSATSR